MNYYIMTGEGIHPVASISNTRGRKQLPKRRWMDGQPLGFEVPELVIYDLDPKYPGNPKALYHAQPVLVMSSAMAKVLEKAGVNNLELFDAILIDPEGKEYSNYKAFNIMGKVSAADMEASSRMGVSGSQMISADFDALVIDQNKAVKGNLLMFRLAENYSAIVVHEKVKNAVEESRIPEMFFYESGEWSG